jgi:hypothetical protein
VNCFNMIEQGNMFKAFAKSGIWLDWATT